MKKLITIVTLIIVSAISAFAQTSGEKEVLKFIADYDQAFINDDIGFFEKNSVEDYTFSYNGIIRNRARVVEDAKQEKANPTEKRISWKTESDSVRVIGNNTAVETGTFHVKGTNADGKPFEETERYTTVWVWRNLRRQIISDHTSTIQTK